MAASRLLAKMRLAGLDAGIFVFMAFLLVRCSPQTVIFSDTFVNYTQTVMGAFWGDRPFADSPRQGGAEATTSTNVASSVWSSVANGERGTACGTVDGASLYFSHLQTREAVTKPFDISGMFGTITSTVLYGAQSGSPWCKDLDLIDGSECALVPGDLKKTKCQTSVKNGDCSRNELGKRGTQAYSNNGENFLADFEGDEAEWGGGKNCEPAEAGEEVILSYSIDNGINWTPIKEFPVSLPRHTYEIEVPKEAHTTHTQFRWRQRNHSSMSLGEARGTPVLWYQWRHRDLFDQWALDDVKVTMQMSQVRREE